MSRKIRKNKPIGEIINLNFNVSFGVATAALFFVVLASLGFSYQWLDRETFKFVSAIVGTAAAVTSAVYVGDSIRLNASERRSDRALQFIADWIDPKFMHCNAAARRIRMAIDNRSPIQRQAVDVIREEMQKDPQIEDCVVAILNYLEAVALAVDQQLADEEILRDYFVVIFRRFCEVYFVWIAERQNQRGSEVYGTLLKVSARWNGLLYPGQGGH